MADRRRPRLAGARPLGAAACVLFALAAVLPGPRAHGAPVAAALAKHDPGPGAQPGALNGGRPAGRVPVGPDRLTLLSQPAWVGPGPSVFRLQIGVQASDPAREDIEVIVYGSLTTRSAFDAALQGDIYGAPYDVTGPVPLKSLVPDPRGGFDIDLPVDQPGGGLPLTTTAVHPVQVFLEQGGVRMGQPLTTFLVYVDKYAKGLKRLQVGLVLPFSAPVPFSPSGVPGPVPAPAAADLEGDAYDLVRWRVPVTLLAGAPTVQSLASGGAAAAAAVAHLRAALQAGDQLLPAPALPLDVQAMVESGLQADLSAELTAGARELGQLVGTVPALTSWASARPLAPATVAALVAMGVRQFVRPPQGLSELPAADSKLTFARPAVLSIAGKRALVVGVDAELSARCSERAATVDPVLVASQVVAELAMVDLESPSDQRGVVVQPYPGPLSPQFLAVLLSGLEGNPLLQPVPVAQLFAQVPVATNGPGPLVQTVAAPSSAVQPLAGTEGLGDAQSVLSADGQVYGARSVLVRSLSQRLALSLSSIYGGGQRAALIGAVQRAAQAALLELRLPSEASITLTARSAKLPLALASGAPSPAHVRLGLRSDLLSFVATRFAEGSCRPVNPGAELCDLVLSQPTTTLQVPVVARASGTFPLYLVLSTPDGARVIARGEVSVRSTAISQVGLVLMVVAALFLAVWWARNARHGRRARRLVPRATAPGPPDEATAESGTAVAAPGHELGPRHRRTAYRRGAS